MTATASNTTATRIDGTAALFIAHLVSSVIYHGDRDKGKCNLRRKATGIRRVGRPVQPEIELIDATVKSHRIDSSENTVQSCVLRTVMRRVPSESGVLVRSNRGLARAPRHFRYRSSERFGQLLRLLNALLERHLDRAKRKPAIARGKCVARKARNHVKVDVEDVLTTVPLVVLANRNAIGTTNRLHCCCNAGECRHQRACEIVADLRDLCHVPGGYDEHVAPVTGLLVTAREYRGVAVAKCENSRR